MLAILSACIMLCIALRVAFIPYGYCTLAVVGFLYYFIPVLTGSDGFGDDLDVGVYKVFFMLAGLMFLATLVKQKNIEFTNFKINASDKVAIYTVSFLTTLIIAYVILAHGVSMVFADKADVEYSTFEFVALRIVVSFSFVIGFLAHNKLAFRVGLLGLVFQFVVGDRTGPVLSSLAVISIWMWGKKPFDVVVKNKSMFFIAMIFGVILIYGKYFQVYFKFIYSGSSTEFVQNINIDLSAEKNLEPYATQAILNRIVKYNYESDPSYLLGLPYIFLPSSQAVGVDSGYFNQKVTNALFHDVEGWGIAYNYYAEGYAFFGYLGVFIFFMINMSLLRVLTNRFVFGGVLYKATMVVLYSYLSFYLYRNSVFSISAYCKQIIYIAILIAFITFVIKITVLGKRKI